MMKKGLFGCILCVFLTQLLACGQNAEIYLEDYKINTQATEALSEESLSLEASEQTELSAAENDEAEKRTKKAEMYYVYICGAVEVPGVYALPEGSRIYEVIESAGGLTEDADLTLVNQAETITDGMMIQIYTQEEAAELSGGGAAGLEGAKEPDDGKININTAGITELMTLPGIGSSKAEAILSYREANGAFSSIEDLMNIPGIKEGIFLQLKEHIKVSDDSGV